MPFLEAILRLNLLNFLCLALLQHNLEKMKMKDENKDKLHNKCIKFILLKWAQTTSEIIFTLELP